jgi:hypothetical protein
MLIFIVLKGCFLLIEIEIISNKMFFDKWMINTYFVLVMKEPLSTQVTCSRILWSSTMHIRRINYLITLLTWSYECLGKLKKNFSSLQLPSSNLSLYGFTIADWFGSSNKQKRSHFFLGNTGFWLFVMYLNLSWIFCPCQKACMKTHLYVGICFLSLWFLKITFV